MTREIVNLDISFTREKVE